MLNPVTRWYSYLAVERKIVVAHFDAKRKETHTCYGYGKSGHVQANCRLKDINGGDNLNTWSDGDSMDIRLNMKKARGIARYI